MAYKAHNANLCLRCPFFRGGVCYKTEYDYCKITRSR